MGNPIHVGVIRVEWPERLAPATGGGASAAEPERARTWVFKVALSRGVWRTVELRADQTLHDLHNVIQSAFGWDNDHLYAFFMTNKAWDRTGEYTHPFVEDAPSAADVTLQELNLQPGQKFMYIFDFGDEIRHRITVVEQRLVEPGVEYPRVLAVRGEAPPQYGVEDW